MPRPTLQLREGLIVTPHPVRILAHQNLSTPLNPNAAYVIRQIRDGPRNGCSYSGEAPHDTRRHTVLTLFGMSDYYCGDVLTVIPSPDCGHLCSPFCVCLDGVLRNAGKMLIDRNSPRHTPSAPPLSVAPPGAGNMFTEILRETRRRETQRRPGQATWRASSSPDIAFSPWTMTVNDSDTTGNGGGGTNGQ
jgi:hypothetical protein